jgi:hypothetical protein
LVAALFALGGCRQILGIDDLSFDLGEGGEGGGGSAEGAGGSGGAAVTTGGGGAGGEAPAGCPTVAQARGGDAVPSFWSTLDGPDAVGTPVVGFGPGVVTGTPDFVVALSGSGMRPVEPEDGATWPAVMERSAANVRLERGTIDLCFRPAAEPASSPPYPIFLVRRGVDSTGIALRIDDGGVLSFSWTFVGGLGRYDVPATAHAMSARSWHRVTASWSFPGEGARDLHLWIDGVERAGEAAGLAPAISPDTTPDYELRVGAGELAQPGTFDEIVAYTEVVAPTGP